MSFEIQFLEADPIDSSESTWPARCSSSSMSLVKICVLEGSELELNWPFSGIRLLRLFSTGSPVKSSPVGRRSVRIVWVWALTNPTMALKIEVLS